jgi:hypothetical protein
MFSRHGHLTVLSGCRLPSLHSSKPAVQWLVSHKVARQSVMHCSCIVEDAIFMRSRQNVMLASCVMLQSWGYARWWHPDAGSSQGDAAVVLAARCICQALQQSIMSATAAGRWSWSPIRMCAACLAGCTVSTAADAALSAAELVLRPCSRACDAHAMAASHC